MRAGYLETYEESACCTLILPGELCDLQVVSHLIVHDRLFFSIKCIQLICGDYLYESAHKQQHGCNAKIVPMPSFYFTTVLVLLYPNY